METENDHCRIGSLETDMLTPLRVKLRSLPHRQLRNLAQSGRCAHLGSLPHRQLRKLKRRPRKLSGRSLPHRQLRNGTCPAIPETP